MPTVDDDLVPLVERLARHCPHTPDPCDTCTDLAVDAVLDLQASGWHIQARRYHNRNKETL